MINLRRVVYFLLCVSFSSNGAPLDDTQCNKLSSLLNSNKERMMLIVNLNRIKAMMEASQRDAEAIAEQMEITGVEILFGCLKEASEAGKYAQISVSSHAAEILYKVFIKNQITTSEYPKFATYHIKIVDGDGKLKLEVTCTTESLVTMKGSLKLLCDFGGR